MQRLVAAGVLYLTGVAIILLIKPNLMFTEDGSWKEFGIGRNTNTHTWMPFWFFAILWALTSYIIVNILFAVYLPPSNHSESVRMVRPTYEDTPQPKSSRRSKGKPMELPDGYYIMNTEGSEAAGGVPKYIYLGKGLPTD
jgi:hypothetical protein